jgi:hypothetical protein
MLIRIETVAKHYTPFVRELRECVRSILENGMGLESEPKLRTNDAQIFSQNRVKRGDTRLQPVENSLA